MAWNPEVYNQFKSDRSAPFYDALNLVEEKEGLDVIDLGCGTGELTVKLAEVLPNALVLGIDSSVEMLRDAGNFKGERVEFIIRSIEEQIELNTKWDLVFSNAAIQWVDNHEQLFPGIIAMLKPGGQLVVQMPNQNLNISNILLNELALKEPFIEALQNWKRESPVLNIEQYAKLLFENGSKKMTVFEKIYPLILKDTDALFDWVSGTALIPYAERLTGEIKSLFIAEYKKLLAKHFSTAPVFYPFKRILLAATF